ncbi:MAG: ATP-dependent zinc metalloprotease FtsH [Opitutales bacterium]|nr:ATP-dependent zinc metalloprotease FtsH [Opitutales bacterium]
MAEPPSDNRNKPLKSGGQYRMLSIWLLVFFVIFSLLYFANSDPRQPEQLTMREVVEEAKLGSDGRILPNAVLKLKPQGGQRWHEVRGELHSSSGENIPFKAEGQLTEANLEILQDSGLFKEEPASTLFTDILLTMLPIMLIILILYFIFVRQLRSAGKGAMNFGKSKARMLTRDREKVTFKDVAGCDEAKEEVAEVVAFLKDPKKFQRVGGRIPKGCLLVGPPGTGKTLIARAVAGEADVPFFSISGSDFVEMFVGVGAARVRDMFEQGRKSAPCIIFVDEIDAVGRQRGAGLGGGNDEREQTLNSLLVEMDGFDGHEGVIIMAATNRPDVLDNALLRPGRFDRQVIIDLPDVKGREEILSVHAKKVTLSDSVNLNIVARNTPGFSGADLANLLNEGALIAARRDKGSVEQADIEAARDKIAYGRERRKLMDDEDKRMTAYHEAGHALVQALIDDGHLPLHKVTIIPRGRALGLTMMLPKKDILGQSRKNLLNQVCCAMAGRLGEEIQTGDFSNGAASDIKQATKIARHMVCDWGMSDLGPVSLGENQEQLFLAKEITRTQNYSEDTAEKIDRAIKQIIDTQYARAKELIDAHKDALVNIAEALLEYETIEGKHVHEIIEFGEIRSPISTVKSEEDEAAKSDEDSEKRSSEDGKKDEGEDGVGSSSPALA